MAHGPPPGWDTVLNKTNIMTDRAGITTLLILAALALIAYANSLQAPFILDDNHMIVENAFIKKAVYYPMFFKGYVTSFAIAKGMCRPLLMLTFAFNYAVGGLNPLSYHITNLCLHLANALLLFFLLKAVLPQSRPAVLVLISALFVVHPLNTEAVTYISSRSDLLFTFFTLAGFLLYLKGRPWVAAAIYAAGLLTKETMLLFPLLIAAHWLLFKQTAAPIPASAKNKKYFLAGLAAVTFGYLVYKSAYFSGLSGPAVRPVLANILIQSRVTFFYLRLFCWPDNLNFLHYMPEPAGLAGVTALAGLAAILGAAVYWRNRHYPITLGILFLLGGLLPKFYATLKVPAAEHHFYFSSLGIYIILAYLSARLSGRFRKLLVYPAAGIIFLATLATVERNHELCDPLTIWSLGTAKESRHVGNWINLGLALKKLGGTESAKQAFKTGLTLAQEDKDWHAGLYINLAGLYFDAGNTKTTEAILRKALKTKPVLVRVCQIYNLLGETKEKAGQPNAAAAYWQRVLKLDPYNAEADQNLARLYAVSSPQRAYAYGLRAVELKPEDFYSYLVLGRICQEQGDLPGALKFYQLSVKANPQWFYSRFSLALAYLNAGDQRFTAELAQAISLNPQFAPAQKLVKDLRQGRLP